MSRPAERLVRGLGHDKPTEEMCLFLRPPALLVALKQATSWRCASSRCLGDARGLGMASHCSMSVPPFNMSLFDDGGLHDRPESRKTRRRPHA